MSLFRIPKPKPYRFKPRYYDEQKEMRIERERRIKKELDMSEDNKSNYISNIRGQMRTGFSDAQRIRRRSNSRLIVILFILFILIYFVFFI